MRRTNRSEASPDAAARETAGITTRLIIAYVRQVLGDEAVARILAVAGERRPAEVLEDEGTWSTYGAKIALFDAAAQVTGDSEVARRIGESVIHARVGGTIKLIVTTLGSPAGVLRSVARANAKFSTVATMRALHVERQRAVISYRLHDGYEPSRHDCAYTAGLLSQVPALFDLPPAVVVHERCQVTGADACVYELRWRARRRLGLRSRARAGSPTNAREDGLHQQLESLQQTALALTTTTDLDELLGLIATRASSAVRGQRYLLAVRLEGERHPRIHAEGFTGPEISEVGRHLLDGLPPSALPLVRDGAEVAVADIVSRGHGYGKLAAFSSPGQEFFPEEHDALRTYANLAASALDGATSLAVARQRQRTAEALLDLARSLSGIEDETGVAAAAARAIPQVTGADRSTLLRWDPDAALLRTAASHGWTPDQDAEVSQLTIGHADTPVLAAMLTDPKAIVLHRDDEDRFVQAELAAYDSQQVAVSPIVHAGEFLGVVIANWSRRSRPPRSDAETVAALTGIGHQVATALATTRLLQQERHRAAHDALTGLPNRMLFEDRLEQSLRELPRSDTGFAVVFADLDRFKQVNDHLGHPAGDELLVRVAERLRAAVRHSDTVSRTGGDEFTLIAHRVSSSDDLARVVQHLRDAMAPPFQLGGHEVYASLSIGASLAPRDGNTRAELLRKADAAMYMAKRDGTGSRLWDPASRDTGDPITAERELREGLARGEFVPVFQPQIELSSGRISGLEALARWHHPARGTLPPSEFLPTAEATGLVVDLDLAILAEALRTGQRWCEDGLCPERIAVNISGRTLMSPRLLPGLRHLLEDTGFPATRLELELTETHLIRDLPLATRVSNELTGLGCTIAIDDTGTGYSTLGTLLQLPIARLKVDRSFVAAMDTNERDRRVVDGILALAAALGHRVVAEGVERATQSAYLARRGCHEGQGYLYARPVPADEITALLRSAKERPLLGQRSAGA